MKTSNIIIIIFAVLLVGSIIWISSLGTMSTQTPTSATPDLTVTTTQLPVATSSAPLSVTNTTQPKSMTTAILTTSKGVITLELYGDQAPKTVENFVKLANSGFYNGTRFHRVIKGFMIQGGDPLSKDPSKESQWGTGGPGYQFADEINPSSDLYKTGYQRGVLAMANSGPNTNGSQFFIMHQNYPLPPLYTIFGKVTSGMDVVDAIATTPTGPNDRPLTDVVLEKVEIK